ncbi:MAG: Asp-tRNA(Asn)/Glu-tRNA(Gln) amidotransferase subunit GatB [Fibrobacter sp.]|nr:Asp-tRNA(Asn)/Glu-tRNA(Gln) amidotransferase subunit GatB [Fibrobacter sp.]
MEYEIVIGLEVHAQLLTNTKLFCGCKSKFGDAPNTNGCPVCLGLPGSLPVLNRAAVEMAIKMGLAVGCSIEKRSIFARKNYFYPDLPKGYQISQYDMPICNHGALDIVVEGEKKRIGITRIHLEEDAGKLIHDQDIDSLFDVNRCGTPLIEIVSEPDMRSPKEAHAYLAGIKQILEYLQICDCNLEEGSMRCDANISLRPKGETRLGTKTEIKNMNTLRGLEKALEYEAQRQEEVLSSGGKILQQTFLWDPATNRSIPMRSKEDAHDYRYFPEPDLLPLVVEQSSIDSIKATLPELPSVRRTRFEKEYGLVPYAAEVLTTERSLADYFEKTVACFSDARQVANWIMGDVLRIVKDQKLSISDLRVTPERLGTLLKSIENGTVSAKAARKVFDLIQSEDKEPEQIIQEQGLKQVSDTGALESAIQKILQDNPSEVERYKGGDKKLMGFFVGQAMKATKGTGNPKEINAILGKLLG